MAGPQIGSKMSGKPGLKAPGTPFKKPLTGRKISSR